MKTALFLGAGASHFVGCPTTKELRELTLANIRKRLGDPIDGDESDSLKFLERIIQDERLDDIEKVYSCVDRILHSSNTYSNAVLDNVTYNDGGISMKFHEILFTLETLKRIIRETMLDRFTVLRGGEMAIEKWYGGLFDVVGDASGSVDIITTNYDNIIETYCDHADMQLADGFVPSRNGDHRIWNDSWDVADGGVRLVKLHGSAAW
ncbi:MAG: SIR2 family protein [Nitrosopumilaceae archaeon]|nr:SIR2 family protein [Nitrosopumilaceae archaeon]